MGGTVVKSLSSSSWYCHQLRGVDSALSKATRSRSKQSSLMYIIGKYKCRCSNNCVTAASKKILRRSRLSQLRDDEWKLRPAAYVMYMCWDKAAAVKRISVCTMERRFGSDPNAACVLIEREDRCTSRGLYVYVWLQRDRSPKGMRDAECNNWSSVIERNCSGIWCALETRECISTLCGVSGRCLWGCTRAASANYYTLANSVRE